MIIFNKNSTYFFKPFNEKNHLTVFYANKEIFISGRSCKKILKKLKIVIVVRQKSNRADSKQREELKRLPKIETLEKHNESSYLTPRAFVLQLSLPFLFSFWIGFYSFYFPQKKKNVFHVFRKTRRIFLFRLGYFSIYSSFSSSDIQRTNNRWPCAVKQKAQFKRKALFL